MKSDLILIIFDAIPISGKTEILKGHFFLVRICQNGFGDPGVLDKDFNTFGFLLSHLGFKRNVT